MASLRQCTLRGQLELVPSESAVRLEDVEPAAEIVKRFVTGKLLISFEDREVSVGVVCGWGGDNSCFY